MRYLFIFLFILTSSAAFSQEITVKFSETRNVDAQLAKIPDPAMRAKIKADLTKSEYYNLQIQFPLSLYSKTVEEATPAANNEMSNSNVQVMQFKSDASSIYQDYSKNEFLQNLSLMGKSFLISDSIPEYDWEILSDEVIIGELSCKKAITSSSGEEITVWFTEEIPISSGPGRLGGLPGLILRAKTPAKDYEAVEIMNSLTSKDLQSMKPHDGKKVSFQEYKKIRSEKVNQLQSGQW
jgi:GLPGLI family protein